MGVEGLILDVKNKKRNQNRGVRSGAVKDVSESKDHRRRLLSTGAGDRNPGTQTLLK